MYVEQPTRRLFQEDLKLSQQYFLQWEVMLQQPFLQVFWVHHQTDED